MVEVDLDLLVSHVSHIFYLLITGTNDERHIL